MSTAAQRRAYSDVWPFCYQGPVPGTSAANTRKEIGFGYLIGGGTNYSIVLGDTISLVDSIIKRQAGPVVNMTIVDTVMVRDSPIGQPFHIPVHYGKLILFKKYDHTIIAQG